MSLQEAKRRTQHQHSESLPSIPSSIDFGGVLGAIESTLQPEDLWPPSARSPDVDSGEARKPAVVGAHGLDDVDVDVAPPRPNDLDLKNPAPLPTPPPSQTRDNDEHARVLEKQKQKKAG